MRRFAYVFIATLLCQQSALAVASPAVVSAHSKGVRYFKHKRYDLAAYHLKLALEADPRNAMLYYYLANSLVHTGRHKDAIVAYQRSYELDPFGTVSGFCRQALLTYKAPLPESRIPKAHGKPLPMFKVGSPQNKTWSGKETKNSEEDRESSQEGEAEEESVAREPTAREQHMNNATAMIRRQAADEKARKKQYADYISDNLVKTGEAKANRIKADAEEQIKELYEGPIFYDSQGIARSRGVPSWRLSPTLQEIVKNRADQIRREAEARAELELSRSHDKSSEYKKWYMDRESDIDSVCEALETQLQQPSGRSGILLNPIGTGLYVRNYSTFVPKHPIPDAHSSVVRMLDRGYVDSPENSRSESDKNSTFKFPTLKHLEVRGTVVE